MKNDIFIGVSLYNNMQYLESQIYNLKQCINNSHLKIKLVYFDDGSKFSNYKIAKEICIENNINIKRLKHKGFGSVCKDITTEGVKCAEYIMHLDSDVFLPSYFFRSVLQTLKFVDKDTGVFSFKSIKTSHYYILENIAQENECYSLDTESLSGDYKLPELATQLATYAFIFKSSCLNHIKGFNSKYLAYYSDSDFCCQLAVKGFKNYRIHFPKVLHIEHGTIGDEGSGLNANELRKHDLEVFKTKWGDIPENIEKKLLKEDK